MNNDDIKKLRSVIREEVTTAVKEEVSSAEQRLSHKIDGSISSAEQRLGEKIKQLSLDIGDFISERVIPLFDEKADKSDIDRLENKIDRIIDKDIEQDRRLDRIESVSVVALELKKPRKH